MQINKYGNGDTKVLIIHGWMHSYKRYEKLAQDLSDKMCVSLVTLYGFGGTSCDIKQNIIDEYIKYLIDFLKYNRFDLIIGHSLGGNLILKMLESDDSIDSKILLLNPAYNGIDSMKYASHFLPVFHFLFILQKKIPLIIAKPLIKIASLISINRYSLIDDICVDDIRSINPYTAKQLMKELAFDEWQVTKPYRNEITIVMSENDRLIKKNKLQKLHSDLNTSKLIIFKNIGHTSVIENYDDVYNLIIDIVM